MQVLVGPMKQSKGEGGMLGAGAEGGQEVAARDGDSLVTKAQHLRQAHLRQIMTKAQHLRVMATKAQQPWFLGMKTGILMKVCQWRPWSLSLH